MGEEPKKSHTEVYLILGALVVGLFVLVGIIILYEVFWKPVPGGVIKCTNSSQCPANNYCASNGLCMALTCTVPSQCGDLQGSQCIGVSTKVNYCLRPKCQTSNDCGPGNICGTNKICLPYSSTNTCQFNSDCYGGELACINGVCAQCSVNTDCAQGQICQNGTCLFPTNTQCDTSTTFISVSNTSRNNNPLLPFGFCCPSSTGLNNTCSSTTPCASGQFCVNGTCRCIKGQLFEPCVSSTDCQSNNCLNGICGYKEGSQCLTNYNLGNNSTPLPCSKSSPYCINGICSQTSQGAFCGGNYNNGNTGICYGNGIYSTAYTTGTDLSAALPPPPNTGMGNYCVNNICSSRAGGLNSVCSTSLDCVAFNTNSMGQNLSFSCTNGRCQVPQ